MIMNTTGRGKSLGSGNNNLVFGEDRLEVRMHKGCLNFLNGMELGNDSQVNFFGELSHSMGIDDLRGACGDAFKLILLFLLLELHG